jgi:MFS family permease
MSTTPASNAAAAASVTILAAIAALGFLIYQASAEIEAQPHLIVLAAIALVSAMALHLVFVGLLARRTGRSPVRYVVIALLTFPIGSIVGLIFYEWSTTVDKPTPERIA